MYEQIEDGEIFATINKKDGMVSFLENPEEYNTAVMCNKLDQKIQAAIGVIYVCVCVCRCVCIVCMYTYKCKHPRPRSVSHVYLCMHMCMYVCISGLCKKLKKVDREIAVNPQYIAKVSLRLNYVGVREYSYANIYTHILIFSYSYTHILILKYIHKT